MKKVLYVVIVLLALCLMAASCNPPKECVDANGNPIDCNAWVEKKSFVDEAKEVVDDLNEDIQNAAVNAEPPAILDELNELPDWSDEEKAEDYGNARDIATDNGTTCGYWGVENGAEVWVSTSCQ